MAQGVSKPEPLHEVTVINYADFNFAFLVA